MPAHSEARYGRLLAPYFDDPSSLFVISSDFCHWGSRFSYNYYDPLHVGTAVQTCWGGKGGRQKLFEKHVI